MAPNAGRETCGTEDEMSCHRGKEKVLPCVKPTRYVREPLTDDSEDEENGVEITWVIPFLEPSPLLGNYWTLEVYGPEFIPWFSSIAGIKQFAQDFPEVRQVARIPGGSFVFRTTLHEDESEPTDLARKLRTKFKQIRTVGRPAHTPIVQILYTK